MNTFPSPSKDAEEKIRKAAILARKDGDKAKAAAWLDRCFTETPADSTDRLFYASAVIALGLDDLIKAPQFREKVDFVRYQQPLLDEPESLRQEYTRYYTPKPDAPQRGFFASLFGGKQKDKKAASSQSSVGDDTRREAYSKLNQSIDMLASGRNLVEAERLVGEALEIFHAIKDENGETDALHIKGRILHEQNRPDEAMEHFEQAMELARYHNNLAQIARAMHEQARIFHNHDYDFIRAEECYRYALHFYAGQRDEANLQVSIDCLSALGQDALSNDEFFLPMIEKEGAPVGPPAGYLHVRGVAIKAEFFIHYNQYMDLLVRWAGQEAERDLPFALYILRELERIAQMKQDIRYFAQVESLKKQLMP